MKVQFAFSAVALCAALLMGCAQSQVAASQPPAVHDVVYVVPNCQTLGGMEHCQWIEPNAGPGVSRDPAPAPARMGVAI